jgi:hypothetical protein
MTQLVWRIDDRTERQAAGKIEEQFSAFCELLFARINATHTHKLNLPDLHVLHWTALIAGDILGP